AGGPRGDHRRRLRRDALETGLQAGPRSRRRPPTAAQPGADAVRPRPHGRFPPVRVLVRADLRPAAVHVTAAERSPAAPYNVSMTPPEPLGIALLDCGTVGGGVATLLLQQSDRLAARAGRPLVLRRIVVRDLERPRAVEVPRDLLTTDLRVVLRDPSVQ